MKRKMISFMVIICMVITLIPTMTINANAATSPASVSEATVKTRINELKSLCGTYFTTDGYAASESTIEKTYNWSVLKNNSKVRALINENKNGYMPSALDNLPTHYQGSSSISKGAWQCAGFANFAEWYIFAGSCSDKVTTKVVALNTDYTYSNLKNKLKPGDIIGETSWPHSMVVVKVTSSGVQVINSNIRNSSSEARGMNRVSVNTFGWDYFSKISIVRATNYSTSWAHSLDISNVESSGKPYLKWNKRTNAAKYKVYRKRVSDSSYKLIKTTTNRYYTDTAATPSYTYMYYVKAVNKSGKTLQSTYAVKRACDLKQPQLKSISCVADSGAIKVVFTGVKNANQYRLYRATSKTGNYEYIAKLNCSTEKGGEAHCFVTTSGQPATTYYYKVGALNTNNSNANSALSSYRYIVKDLARPVLAGIDNIPATGGIRIYFSGVKGANCYKLYRATSAGGTYEYLAKIDCSTDSGGESHYFVNNNNCTVGKTYYYKVRATNTATSAADSALSTYKCKMRVLARPVVTLSYTTAGYIKVSWAKISGADKYEIYRATSEYGEYTKIGSTSNTSAINMKNLKAGQTYCYKVVAVSDSYSAATSAYSEVKFMTYTGN